MSALRAPFPWFGGKSRAARLVWDALGDVANYVEPFFGSGAVLLARPHAPRLETVNDASRFLANFWRAVAHDPDAVALHCDWPVNETDLHARHRWLVAQLPALAKLLDADPEAHDAKIAGWWCWGACAWIGTGWCGESVAEVRELHPHLGDAGMGVHAPSRQLPHLSTGGMGVHAPRRGRAVGTDHVDVESVDGWMHALAARLRAVRVACGDWRRVVASPSVLFPAGRSNPGYLAGVYLDPPYAEGNADYAVGGTGTTLSAEVRAWCEEHDRDPRVRIVLSGYEGEHAALERRGWRVAEWKANGGYSNAGGNNVNRHRERLWLSPHCVGARQPGLFDAGGAR